MSAFIAINVNDERSSSIGSSYFSGYKYFDGFVESSISSNGRIPLLMILTNKKKTCKWIKHKDYRREYFYSIECKGDSTMNSYSFPEGTPEDNLYKFCQFCGKDIQEINEEFEEYEDR